MRLPTVVLKEALSLFVPSLDKVLNVRRAVLTFLELACHEDHTRDLRPGLEVILSLHLRVVQCPNHHTCLCHSVPSFIIILINDGTVYY